MSREEFKEMFQQEFERLYNQKKQEEGKFNFKDTETLISAYPGFLAQIENYKIKIEELKSDNAVIIKNAANDVNVQTSFQYKSEIEKKEEMIANYEARIKRLQSITNQINNALNSVSNDKYYSIIELKYMNRLTNYEIAAKLEIEESTVRRHKNKLISKIKYILFA